MNAKLLTKADDVVWNEVDDDFEAVIKTVRDMVSWPRPSADARRRKVYEILATIRHDIVAVETDPEESKAKIVSDADQAANAPNGLIDSTTKDTTATQEIPHMTQSSLSDCFSEAAVVRSNLERSVTDTKMQLKNDIRQKQQEAFEKPADVDQPAELRLVEVDGQKNSESDPEDGEATEHECDNPEGAPDEGPQDDDQGVVIRAPNDLSSWRGTLVQSTWGVQPESRDRSTKGLLEAT